MDLHKKSKNLRKNIIINSVTLLFAFICNAQSFEDFPDQTYGNYKISTELKLVILSENLEITGSQTWENETDFPGDIIFVENGATLTIKNTLTVSPQTKIVVKRGGKLVLDGGTITGQQPWKGIEVWGTATASQNPADQGWVKIINDGTLENAKVGIRAVRVEDDGGESYLNYNFAGGIVQATNATFRNNRFAVIFYDYEFVSQSNFSDCDFITDNSYPGETGPFYFIKMTQVNGIDFTYCRFINNHPEACNGSGIYSFNSGYSVKGKCVSGQPPCQEWANGEFVNLERGIYATSGGSLHFPEIDHITFTGNHRGVYFSAMENGSVSNCTITTGPNLSGGSYGIYLDRSTGYTIEDNTFLEGTAEAIGMVINKSGGEPNRIYRNYFEGLKFGIIAQNENRAPDGTGLVLKCNEYTGNNYDQVVLWNGPLENSKAGIAAEQGADLGSPDTPAGNRFSYTGPTLDDPTDIYNEANDVIYYYHLDNLEPLMPEYITDETVFPEPVINALWNEQSCPPSNQGGGGGSGDSGEMKSMVALSGYKADSVLGIIHILKDGGSTESLKWEVDMSTPQQTYEVYNDLMNNSPYISDTVMEAAIEKEDVLPNVMIRDVMVANPHNAKNDALLEKINERANPMPDYMKAQILQGQSLVSVFENLQSKLAFYKQQRSLAFNSLMTYYLTDTINPPGALDSLAVLLENETGVSAKYRLAFLSLGQGEWTTGQNILNSIPGQFNLDGEELEAHQQLVNYYSLLSGLAQDGRSIAESDSAQIEMLFDIKETDAGKPSVYARNILLVLDETDYDEPVLMPDFQKSIAVHEEYEELMKSLDEHYYHKIFPNPAGDYLILEHKLETEPENAFISIRNTKGDVVKYTEISGKQNQQTIDIKGLEPGVYISTLYVNNKELESVKFSKLK